jgi:hypothetical protein
VREEPSIAAASWRQVGVVCLMRGAQITVDEAYKPGDAHDELASQACRLGGERVTPIGTCGKNADGIEFGVYRART